MQGNVYNKNLLLHTQKHAHAHTIMWRVHTRTCCSLVLIMTIYFLCFPDLLSGYYSSVWVFISYLLFTPLSSSLSLQHFVLAWSKFHLDDICMFILIYQASFWSMLLYSKEPATPQSSVSLTIFIHNYCSTIQNIAKIFHVSRPKPSKMEHEMTHKD